MKSKYSLIMAEKSFCPKCNQSVKLLSHEYNKHSPMFYICFNCETVAQVGVGQVSDETPHFPTPIVPDSEMDRVKKLSAADPTNRGHLTQP